MQASRLEILSGKEIELIHQRTLEILEETGLKVELKKMRHRLRDEGCPVDEDKLIVKFKTDLVERCLKMAPREFIIRGADPNKQWRMNAESRLYGGLGTAINYTDLETGEYRPTTLRDLVHHLALFEQLDNVTTNQMDVWPNDVPMHTIHVQAIRAWARNCTKPFGLGAYGVLATRDMMEMTALVMGGREAMKDRHPFMTIVNTHSPLATARIQLEGLMILAEWGQPALISPEAMAGTTAPVTLAGLLVQHNAEIIGHVVMAQLVHPGTPVVYGSVSTIAEMKRGMVALGAVETGLISAASAQLAHYYGLPCRAVAGGTEAKTLDLQCGLERSRTIMLAALAGANYITCVGTTESSTAGAHELAVIDNEIIGGVERAVRGIEVNETTLAAEVIKKVGSSGNYLMEEHTQRHFRGEHFLPQVSDRDKRDIWEEGGRRDMVVRAGEAARKILAQHREKELEPTLARELDRYVALVEQRSLDEFYAAEWE
ncbi:MAG: trimethylamine methyltransferase family protein [Thermodesulfobacteriota bacterium]